MTHEEKGKEGQTGSSKKPKWIGGWAWAIIIGLIIIVPLGALMTRSGNSNKNNDQNRNQNGQSDQNFGSEIYVSGDISVPVGPEPKVLRIKPGYSFWFDPSVPMQIVDRGGNDYKIYPAMKNNIPGGAANRLWTISTLNGNMGVLDFWKFEPIKTTY